MPLTLTLREPTSIPIEVDAVRLEIVRGQSADEVRRVRVPRGNKQPELGEFFSVQGSAADDEHVVWVGDCHKVKGIGAGLCGGRMTVEGIAGMHLGARMRSGELVCTGDAGDWAGAEMSGGRLRIRGNAGNCLGAAYRGARRGMTGGEIFVEGDAGDEVGSALRRGLIAIGGAAGHAVGFGLLAGTILVFGPAGLRAGAGMRRGTIVLAQETPAALLPTFAYATTGPFAFLEVLLRHLKRSGFDIPPDCRGVSWQRYSGDLLEGGRGEILLPAAPA